MPKFSLAMARRWGLSVAMATPSSLLALHLLLEPAPRPAAAQPAGLPLSTAWRGGEPGTTAAARAPGAVDPLTGGRSPMRKDWIGLRVVSPETPILVMAGHADAQGIAGSGTIPDRPSEQSR